MYGYQVGDTVYLFDGGSSAASTPVEMRYAGDTRDGGCKLKGATGRWVRITARGYVHGSSSSMYADYIAPKDQQTEKAQHAKARAALFTAHLRFRKNLEAAAVGFFTGRYPVADLSERLPMLREQLAQAAEQLDAAERIAAGGAL